jgi:hypothetical protein
VPDQDDPKPRSRSKSSRKKSHPADIAAEAEAQAAAAAKPRRKEKASNPPETPSAGTQGPEAEALSSGSSSAEPAPAPEPPTSPISPVSASPRPAPEPVERRRVENWLAQRLAALDPGDEEDVGDPATHIARPDNRSRASQPPLRGAPTGRAPASTPPRVGARRPTPTVPTPAPASVAVQRRSQRESPTGPPSPSEDLTGPGPARIQVPGHGANAQPTPGPAAGLQEMQVMVVASSVPTPPLPPRSSSEFAPIDSDVVDEKTPIPQEPWPDFEPLSLPSEEVEPLDELAAPLGPHPAEPEPPRPLPAGRFDENEAWDLLGESDGRGRPAVDDERTGPGGWATPLPSERSHGPIAQVQVGSQAATPASQEATVVGIGHMPKARASLPSSPPVVKSTPAPVRPRGPHEEAQVDALIAEVERDSKPRRKPGPFSRWNEDAENSDPGDKRRTSVNPSMVPTLTTVDPQTQTRVDEGVGSYDEVFPQPGAAGAGGVARVQARSPARDEETAALLMDPEPAPQAPILPPLRPSPGVTGNTPPPAPTSAGPQGDTVVPTPETAHTTEESASDPASKTEWRPRAFREGAKGKDLDEKPLADEKTEIRSFTPKIDTVGDEDAPTAQTQRVEAVTAADLPTVPELAPPRERGVFNLWPWMSVGAGMLAFLVPLGIFAAILMVVKWFM